VSAQPHDLPIRVFLCPLCASVFSVLNSNLLLSVRKRRHALAIYQTGGYQVKPSAVEKVKKAIKEFVAYVQANEPGTRMYLAWQQQDDPTRFLHLFIFEDEAAQARHGESDAVKRFESIYSPELIGGDVVFTDYEMIAGKPTADQWTQLRPASKSSGV
jgi:quinol monooxygenase YgiN